MKSLISWVSRLPIAVHALVFALLSIVPLALLAHFSVRLAGDAVSQEVRARVRNTAAVSAVSVQQQMQSLAELVRSYAERPNLLEAMDKRATGRYDRPAISSHLTNLLEARPGIGVAFVATPKGRLIDILPRTPSIIGDDFSYRDWYRGVTRTRGPYISEAYESAATNHPRVVAAAVNMRIPSGESGRGRNAGILVAAYGVETVQAFVEDFARAQNINLTVTDQRGVLVAAPGANPSGLISMRADPAVAAALDGRSGVTEQNGPDGRVLSAYAPIQGIGWTISAEVPADTAFAEVSTLRSTVLVIAGLLGLVLLGGLLLLLFTLRERARTDKTLKESEERTRSIIEAAQDAFVSMDVEGLITGWNRQAEKTFGWPRAEVLGRELSTTIVPMQYREAHIQGLRRFLDTGEGPVLNERIEIEALHRDGSTFAVELAIWPARSGDTYSFNAFIQDITERKRTEEELAVAHERAMAASRLKSEFLANMSHEIRTPMNGVIGMTALLLGTNLTGEQREYAETISSSGEAMLTLINDILDFSKIEAGKMSIESIDFDVRTVVEEVADILAEQAHAKGLELATLIGPDVPPIMRGDPGRVRQVLINLAGNAVKFTKAGEVVVRVRLEEQNQDDALVCFEVTDTGIGISSEEQARLFQSFSQADASSTRKYGGTGLGLAISKRLAHLMNGEIGVRSEAGRGSTFWFTARLGIGTENISAAPAKQAQLKGMNVLVVDDNAANRAIIEQNLISWGISPESAEDAAEALRMLREAADRGQPYPLAILDYLMPGTDGIQLAAAIKNDPLIPPARLVLLTSSGERGEARTAHEAGIEAYLTKPVRQSSLYDCIATVIGRQDGQAPEHLVTRDTLAETKAKLRAHILVAEDNVVNQKVAVLSLQKIGHRVDVAANGVEAVDAVSRVPYQAVLMDCQMPEMDGYEATMEIRRLEKPPKHTPIIAMTAGAMKGDKEKALAAGMDDYVTKPVKLEDLAAVLERWIVIADPVRDSSGPLGDVIGESDGEPVDTGVDTGIEAALQEFETMGGRPFVEELIAIFLEESTSSLESLREAEVEADAQKMALVSHGLKGSSRTLGATHMGELCEQLEKLANTKNLETATQLLGRVETEFGRVSVALGTRHS